MVRGSTSLLSITANGDSVLGEVGAVARREGCRAPRRNLATKSGGHKYVWRQFTEDDGRQLPPRFLGYVPLSLVETLGLTRLLWLGRHFRGWAVEYGNTYNLRILFENRVSLLLCRRRCRY